MNVLSLVANREAGKCPPDTSCSSGQHRQGLSSRANLTAHQSAAWFSKAPETLVLSQDRDRCSVERGMCHAAAAAAAAAAVVVVVAPLKATLQCLSDATVLAGSLMPKTGVSCCASLSPRLSTKTLESARAMHAFVPDEQLLPPQVLLPPCLPVLETHPETLSSVHHLCMILPIVESISRLCGELWARWLFRETQDELCEARQSE